MSRRIVRALVGVQIKSLKQDLAQLGRLGFSEGTAHLIAFLLVQRWKPKVSDYSLERKVLYYQEQWFSNCSFHHNHMEGLLKYISLIQRTWGLGVTICISNHLSGDALLLVQGTYFKNFRVTYVFSFNSQPMRLDIPADPGGVK